MSSAILFNEPTSIQPPLAFATPAPSPGLVLLRRRERAANEPPPLLKRKRTPPSTCSSDAKVAASYLPTIAKFPYLDCEIFGYGREGTHGGSASSIPLPNVMLYPRMKRSRTGCFLSSSPQDQDDHDQSNYKLESRGTRVNIAPNEENDEVAKNTDAAIPTSLIRTSSSKSMLTRRPSMNLTRSLSLQFNSLLNLAAAAANNGASDVCPLSASTSSLMPHRKSFLHIPRSSFSSQDMPNLDVNENKEPNHRRSPVATTLDYFATAMRFPDVAIGLSI